MANIVDFGLTMVGPPDQLDQLREMFLGDVQTISEAPYSGGMYFRPSADTWGDPKAGAFWVKDIIQYTGRSAVNDYPVYGELRVFGEAKWFPPLLLAQCVREKFPEVVIDIWSTTEHELYEEWRAEEWSRRLYCRYEELTDIKEDRIVRLVINGKQIIPANASSTEGTEQ